MGRRYLKATELLSEDLLETVSKALGGRSAFIWIPSSETLKRDRRDAYILRLHEEGNTAEEIADRLFLNIRTVFRAFERMEKKAASLLSREDKGE